MAHWDVGLELLLWRIVAFGVILVGIGVLARRAFERFSTPAAAEPKGRRQRQPGSRVAPDD